MPNKIRLALVLLLVLLFSGVGFATINPSKPQKGDGTIDNPYEITSAAELYWLASTVNDGKCASSTVKNGNCSAKLMEDITVNKYVLTDENGVSKVGADGTYKGNAPENVWTPIGNSSRKYTGVFDGDGHTISGVYFNNANKDTVGLFGVLYGGSVKGVGVTDSYIRGRNCVGSIVGFNRFLSNNAVTDVYNAGLVSGKNYVGGILGCNSGSVGNVYNTGNVSGNDHVGGIVGQNQAAQGSSLYNAYSIGAVSGENKVGGVAGSNEVGASISNSYYNVEFFSGSAVGVNPGSSSTNEVYGMSSVDFAFLDIEKAFPESDAWVRFGGEQPIMDNGKLFYKLPGLKTFKDVYPKVESRVLGIGTAEQLMEFAQQVNAGDTKINAKLTAHIVLNKNVLKDGTLNGDGSSFTKWTPIGTAANPYEGSFDGDGFTISGLYINDNEKDTVGLFGKIANTGVVKKLGMLDSYIKGRNDVGGVVGYNDGGSVSDVYGTCFVSGNQKVGGLVGYNKGTVGSVYEVGSVSGVESGVGGIVGYNDGGSVSNGYFDMNMPCENCSNLAGVQGLLISELAKTLPTGFSKDVWETGSIETDNDGNVIFKLHYLKGANTVPPVVMLDVDTDKYLKISNERDLNLFAGLVNSGATEINAKLAAHIVLNANVLKDGALNGDGSGFTSWTPIGTQAYPYVGTFDGKGFTVSGLYFNDDDVSAVGFFGRLGKEGTVKNVGVTDSYIKGRDYVGSVVGSNGGSVNNAYNAGSVSGQRYVGGVVGSGSVSVAYNAGAVSGQTYVGGVVGSGSVSDVYNMGSVSASGGLFGGSNAGGIVGSNNSGSVNNAYNVGLVSVKSGNAGGIVGLNNSGSVSNSYYNTEIFNGNAVGTTLNSGSLTNVSGKTALELATFDVSEAFSGSDAWVRYEGSQPILDNEKLICRLPGLKAFKDVYPEYVLLQLKNGVYEIGTADQLKGFVQFVNNGNSKANAKLTADIVLNKDVFKDGKLNVADTSKFTKWTPIKSFEGTFNGDGHTISGVYFNDDKKDSVGFFGKIGNAGVVENVGFVNSYIKGKNYVGGVTAVNLGSVSNVYNTGAVGGNQNVGGLVGYNKGSVSNVYNSASVSGTDAIGGVAGVNDKGSINNGYYNIELFNGNAVGKTQNSGSTKNVSGKTTMELATLDVDKAFSGSDAWVRYEGEQPVLENGKLIYKLLGLRASQNFYPEYVLLQPENGVYEIGTADQLKGFARIVNSGNIKINAKLTADIVLNTDVFKEGTLNVADTSKFTKWTVIKSFEGTFDGDGHTISGLYFNNDKKDSVGLFGKIGNGIGNVGFVENVGIVDSYIKGKDYVGSVTAVNLGSVSNVYNTGAVGGNQNVGGLVGYNKGSVSNVYNSASVSGTDAIGGVAGVDDGGSVSNSYYNTEIFNGNAVGTTLNSGSLTNVSGKTVLELASLDVGSAFPGSDAWIRYEGSQPVLEKEKLICRLPGLKASQNFYPEYVLLQPKNGVYEIGTANQLKGFAQFVNNGNTKVDAKLTADIVFNKNVLEDENGNLKVDAKGNYTGTEPANVWTPIGSNQRPYIGTFNGDGHTISGLYLNNGNWNYVGFFGRIGGGRYSNTGVVENVGIVDSYIKGKSYVGGVVGFNDGGSVRSVFGNGYVKGVFQVGGVVGFNDGDGSIENVYSLGYVIGEQKVGGVVGWGSVNDAFSVSSVSGIAYGVGAVIGDGVVSNSYFNTESSCVNCQNFAGTLGLTISELASLDVDKAFPGSEAWTRYEGEQPVLENGKLVYKLPGLKAFKDVYPEYVLLQLKNGVYEIGTADQLIWFAQIVNSGNTKINARLTANIVLNENVLRDGALNVADTSKFTKWTPIKSFEGTFDGDGHTISGLYFNNDKKDSVGLFGKIGGTGVVENVGVVYSYIKGKDYVGSVAAVNLGSVSDVYSAGSVSGNKNVGGLVGHNEDGKVSCVYYTGSVVANSEYVGGIVGYNNRGAIGDVYNTGSVSGQRYVGGIVGSNDGGAVTNVYNVGIVKGSEETVGGIAGFNGRDGASIKYGYYSTDSFKGNVSGEGNGTIESSMGKTMSDLVSLDVNKDFPGSSAWSNYEGEQPILKDDWSVICKLPGLTAFKNVYPEVIDPSVYEIGSAEQLKEFARRVNNGEIKINARLTADIVLNKNVLDGDFLNGDGSNFSQWTPIGTEKNPYQGIFNGNGHTISGIYINNDNMSYVGLFGIIENSGVAANVGVVDSYIGGGLFVGGIVGFNKGTVNRVFNMAMIFGEGYFGGLAGKNEGEIRDAFNTNSVRGVGDNAGGIVGENAGVVKNVYNAGSVKGGNYFVGSIVGKNSGDGKVYKAVAGSVEQLASLNVSSAFPESDAWIAYTGEQPVLRDDGMMVYKLPSFKVFNAYPEINVESYGGVIEIKTAAQLKGLAQRVNNGDTKIDVVLGADICLNACEEGEKPLLEQIANGKRDFVQWTPIGVPGKPYVGNFDGKGHTIRGLFIDNENMKQVGLFGVIGVSGTAAGVSASVKNVGLIDSYVKGADVVGGVVGLNDKASISDVYNAGTVYGAWWVGGVVGHNNSGSATNVYNLGEVKGEQYVGGVVGYNSGKVSDAYNMGSVSSEGYYVGGVVGYNMAFVDNVYSSADVKAPGYDGGAVGYSQRGSINNVYYNTDMICEHCGGSVGFVEGEAFVTNASGMTTAQLAALDVAEAFKGSEAWVNAPKDNPTMNNGKLIYKLPGLKAFSGLYPDVEFTVYQISNADELKQFALRVNNGENKIHGELTRNIELNSGVLKDGSLNVTGTSKFTKWTPIGTNANPYAGVFDGKGFTISGLYFNDATRDTVGLFGKIANSGTVKNVGLIDSYINGKNNIGGIAGYEDGCFFSNVYNVGIVVGINAVGGIAGFSRGSLSEVYNMGSVKGDAYVGGVVGYKEYGSVAKNYNMGAVSGYYEVGGLVGRNAKASVSNSYNKGKVSVVKADGNVVGGIVGHNLLGALVNDVYNMGEVCANLNVGGIVGAFEDGSMSNAYSSADVSGNGFVGGTVGYSKNGSISNVYYNTDMICKNCGGIIGTAGENTSVTNAFGKTTAQLAALDVASAFPNAEGIWKSGSVVNGENGTVIYKLPYLSKFEESNQPSITGSLEVSVANNDVYLKSDAVTNEDFKVSLVVNGRRSADKDGEFKFTKSTWGEDGVVKGAYDGVNFTLKAPSVVISSDKKKAKVFGYSENTVEIAENVDVPKIDFTRKLYKGKFSTVMFPFTPNEAIKNSGFYRFKDVSKNAEGKWQVHLGKAKEVLANTPYIMVVGDNGDGKEYVESISLNEGGVFSATPLKEYAVSGCLEENLPDCVESGWKFIGSYEYTKWTDDNERASEIGKTYAFAGANGLSQGMKIGQFAKVGTGAYLYPMRAYLQYTGGAKAARAVPGSAREPAVSAELPENIDVVVDGESDSDEKTTVIGSFNTRTGEITPVKNSYFDVKGRNLGNKKPNVKGSFYR